MNRTRAVVFAIAALGASVPVAAATQRLAFSGGPEGGTFQYFSNGIANRLSKTLTGVSVSNMASAGSLENLRRVNSGEADFGIVYSGDLYLARHGRLTRDTRRYTQVHALAYLYGAPAHLIVLERSGVQDVRGMAAQRVAVGGAGSGAAGAAQRYFTALGLWPRTAQARGAPGKLKAEFIGYSKAASALGDGLVDAMWVFAGFPNAAVIQAAASNRVRLLDVAGPAQEAGFFKEYPFYTRVTIPKGTYSGVVHDVPSFQDSALWVAGQHVAPELVAKALAEIFSPAGLAYMVKVKSTARAMSVPAGLDGIVTPVHAGAERYWKQQGLSITADQSAR